MRNFDSFTITEAVLQKVGQTADPRARHISEALVRHLHDFVREVRPTEDEWAEAIGFLTRVGHMCDAKRQEFILLSDTLGVSMLVDAINHGQGEGEVRATETTVLGPFYVPSPPTHACGDDISGGLVGKPFFVDGTVTSVDGSPLAGAVLDVWHADAAGFYDVQQREDLAGRARLHTDVNGRFHFWSVCPVAYPIPQDGPVGAMLEVQGRHPYRPAHVHFKISAPGHTSLVTHVFAAGDEYLDSDVVFGVKDSLVAPYVEHPPGTAPDGRAMPEGYSHLHYDFRLKRP